MTALKFTLPLMIAALLCGGALSAQEHAAPAAESAPHAVPHSSEAPAADTHAPAHAEEAHAPEAHATDDHAVEGHAVESHAAEAGAVHEDKIWGVRATIWVAINLSIFILGVYFMLRKPAAGFFSGRARDIKAQLDEAVNAKLEAEARQKELQGRMDRLAGEVDVLRAEAAQDAERLKAQIQREAEEESARLLQQVRDEIGAAERAAKSRLQAAAAHEAAVLAAQMAQGKLQPDDHDRLVEGLAQSLTEVSGG